MPYCLIPLTLPNNRKVDGIKREKYMEETQRLVEAITKGIQEKKGSNIVVADLGQVEGSICKYFVICQGQSPSQVEAITESVGYTVDAEQGEKPAKIAGLGYSHWVAMDYVDVLVHIFLPEERQYYDLEHLWEDAKITAIPDIVS